jgi:hypothetical protein
LNRGSELFVLAETKASEILLAPPPPMTDINGKT